MSGFHRAVRRCAGAIASFVGGVLTIDYSGLARRFRINWRLRFERRADSICQVAYEGLTYTVYRYRGVHSGYTLDISDGRKMMGRAWVSTLEEAVESMHKLIITGSCDRLSSRKPELEECNSIRLPVNGVSTSLAVPVCSSRRSRVSPINNSRSPSASSQAAH